MGQSDCPAPDIVHCCMEFRRHWQAPANRYRKPSSTYLRHQLVKRTIIKGCNVCGEMTGQICGRNSTLQCNDAYLAARTGETRARRDNFSVYGGTCGLAVRTSRPA